MPQEKFWYNHLFEFGKVPMRIHHYIYQPFFIYLPIFASNMCLRDSQFAERMATRQAWRVNCYDIQIWDKGETLDYLIRFEPALQNWAMSLVLCFAIDILALQAIDKSYTRSTLSCKNSGDQDGPVCSWNGRIRSLLGCTKSFYEGRETSIFFSGSSRHRCCQKTTE